MREGWPAGLAVASVAAAVAAAVFSCRAPVPEPPADERITVARPGPSLTFAVIGDYGLAGDAERDVANLVTGWSPEMIITLGDNNYPSGRANTIDQNIGQYYQQFISPYRGSFGPGADINRFFPSLGNHDWRTTDLAPYRDYFTLPGNERYYDFVWGPVHFFAIDSDNQEPDGNTPKSVQGLWLQRALADSEAPWRIVYMHHAPLSSGDHGSSPRMQWPFIGWGADVVMAGHDHHYERIDRDGGVYIVNGLGGNPKRYPIGRPIKGSRVSFNEAHGAVRGRATTRRLELEFMRADGRTVDTFALEKADMPAPPSEPDNLDPLPPPTFETYDD